MTHLVPRSPITNCWGQARIQGPRSEHFLVFEGVEGAAYNHHHQLTSFEGRLFATWSNGAVHEDGPGQRMLMAVSEDGGASWSAPETLVERQPGRVGDAVVTAEGIHVHGGGMTAFYGYYDYDERGVRTHLERGNYPKQEPDFRVNFATHTGVLVSEDGGQSWLGPVAKIDRFVPNLGPHRLSSGRLILPGNMWFPFTDDPRGITGWTIAGLSRLPEGYYDDPEGFWYGMWHRGDSFAVCEGSCFETDDGVVHMMLRIENGSSDIRALAVSESRDGGESWSEPALTDYSDCSCRFHFGRLPDGRFIGVSCPEPGSPRTPMVAALSRDGVVFDQHFILGEEPAGTPRIPGHHKGGRYGYPSFHVMGDHLFVIYSIQKEDIAVCRVALADLA